MEKKSKKTKELDKITIRKSSSREVFWFIGLITLSGFLIFFNVFFGVLAAYYSYAYITGSLNLISSFRSFFFFWSLDWIVLVFSLIGAYLLRRKE